ncbi:HAMP domain-containing sensor histidine kinase [Actinoplanes sp. NPDC051346]|uniref:sensor histidine kinase n=1 Tax=Actinoplanes sp. NPDC051346 TaxID=3155048 RepID=UPI00343F6CAC
MIVLLAILGLVVGATAEIYLHKTLYDRLDSQLKAMASRAQPRPGPPGGPGPGGRQIRDDPPPGAQDDSIFVQLRSAGGVKGGIVSLGTDDDNFPENKLAPLPDATVTQLSQVTPNNNPTDIDLGELGDYRVISTAVPGGVVVAAVPLAETRETLLAVAWVTGGAVVLALVAAGWAGAAIIRRDLRPLSRVAATATKVSELRLDRGEVELAQRVPESDTDPRTEVGAVGAALNRMLDHVGNALEARHASETQVRQFVADASHELRTPLAAIRGYAELSRRSRQPVPEEIAHVLRRVESEAGRMTTLVEDLLLLARLDAGRPLAHDPVDLTMLVVDSVSDAHAAGPRHDWQLDLPEEPVTVTGDGQRLHQVLANLLANARTHTPEGTTVIVGVAAEGDAAVLRVTDAGPGIPAELRPHIFERFARGDNSRSRAAGSTGLGLSIVHAVVTAHGGAVEVDSAPGRTRFTVRLPLTPELPTEADAVHQHVPQVVQ